MSDDPRTPEPTSVMEGEEQAPATPNGEDYLYEEVSGEEEEDSDDIQLTLDNSQVANALKRAAPSAARNVLSGPIQLSNSATGSGQASGSAQPQARMSHSKAREVEIDIDQLEEKPWKQPGAILSDYFNYGFNEDTWRAYTQKQHQLRMQNQNQGKIAILDTTGPTPSNEAKPPSKPNFHRGHHGHHQSGGKDNAVISLTANAPPARQQIPTHYGNHGPEYGAGSLKRSRDQRDEPRGSRERDNYGGRTGPHYGSRDNDRRSSDRRY